MGEQWVQQQICFHSGVSWVCLPSKGSVSQEYIERSTQKKGGGCTRVKASPWTSGETWAIRSIMSSICRLKTLLLCPVLKTIGQASSGMASFIWDAIITINCLREYPIGLPYLKAYAYFNHKAEDFPVTYSYQNELLSLPVYPEMTKDMVKYVAEKIMDY